MTLCFSHIERSEAIRRVKEVAFTFGMSSSSGSGHKNDVSGASDVDSLKNFVLLLKQRERKRLAWFRKSPEIKYRKSLVDFIMRLCEWESLTSDTTYLAIYLLDRFMDRHSIITEHLGMLATVCVSVSGKLFETNNKTPSYRQLAKHLTEFSYACRRRLVGLEEFVLKFFSFDILIPTEINFLEVYLLYIVDGTQAIGNDENNNNDDDDNNNNNNDSMYPNANYPEGIPEARSIESEFDHNKASLASSNCVESAEKLVAMFELAFLILEKITLNGEPNNSFQPSLIAAAIILASRREYGFNFWTPTLQTVTSYNLKQICHCLVNYLEPILAKLKLSQPFYNPHFENTIFKPCITTTVKKKGQDQGGEAMMF